MTAVMYYHRFRLAHMEADYMIIVSNLQELFATESDMSQDAAAAALFTACKIEDTLKKSRDILCAAYNLKASLSDHLTPDDPVGVVDFMGL